MVYKKYIKRGKKTFGPYYYKSYRDGHGKVKTEFISGPTKKDKIIKKSNKLPYKNLFLILMFILVAFILGVMGNLSYYTKTTGKIVYGPISIIAKEVVIAHQIATNNIVSNVDLTKVVNLKVMQPSPMRNKLIELSTPDGKIVLEFHLLNYSAFISSGVEKEVGAENFSINVQESSEKYKWGYSVKLKEAKFMVKIIVISEETIEVVDSRTLKIGENYLSFADLIRQGYIVSMNIPAISGRTTPQVPTGSQDIVTGSQDISTGSPTYTGSPAYIGGTSSYIPSSGAYIPSSGTSSYISLPQETPYFKLEKIISLIIGFFVNGISGWVVGEENKVSVYAQKEFNESELVDMRYIITLDPILIRIAEEPPVEPPTEPPETPPETETPSRATSAYSGECTSNWKCEEWSKCEISYSFGDIVEDKVFLEGEQTRKCEDLNKCFFDMIERKVCDTKLPISAKKVVRCKDYTEIRDEQGVLVNRLELTNKPSPKLDIQIVLGNLEYYPYCYDGVKDCDEDEVDCVYELGGSCPVCKKEIPAKTAMEISPIILLILIVLVSLCVLWAVGYFVYGREKIKKATIE